MTKVTSQSQNGKQEMDEDNDSECEEIGSKKDRQTDRQVYVHYNIKVVKAKGITNQGRQLILN